MEKEQNNIRDDYINIFIKKNKILFNMNNKRPIEQFMMNNQSRNKKCSNLENDNSKKEYLFTTSILPYKTISITNQFLSLNKISPSKKAYKLDKKHSIKIIPIKKTNPKINPNRSLTNLITKSKNLTINSTINLTPSHNKKKLKFKRNEVIHNKLFNITEFINPLTNSTKNINRIIIDRTYPLYKLSDNMDNLFPKGQGLEYKLVDLENHNKNLLKIKETLKIYKEYKESAVQTLNKDY